MKKWLKVLLIILAVAVVATVAIFLFFPPQSAVTVESLNLDSATVTRGNIDVLVHGTGMLEVDEISEVYTRVAGHVAKVYKEDGDPVEAGELLVLLQSDVLEDTLRTTSDDLYLKDLELSSTRTGRTVSSIRASTAGRVKQLNAQKGDDMKTVQQQHGALAVISTDGRMRVELPAVENWAELTVPQSVKVQIGAQVENGTLLSATADGLSVQIQNDTYPVGDIAVVKDEAGSDLGSGALLVNKPVALTGVSGKIKSVEVKEGDKVNAQDRIFTLEDDAVSVDLEKAIFARDDLQHQLDDTREKITRLEIRSPLTGVVANIAVKEGASVQDGQQVATVIKTDRAKVRLAVDELDVAQVLPGMPATIKIDALPGKKYPSAVDRVLPIGTRENDITNYDVLLYLDNQDNMLPYMSLSGDITVAAEQNVLLVPVSALQTIGEDKYVMMMPTDADLIGYNASQPRYSSPMMAMMGGNNGNLTAIQSIAPQLMRRVEIGLVSGEYAQVLSGLSEGERIVIPRSGTNMMQMMRGMNGGGL